MTAHPYSPNYQAMGDCNVCGLQRDDNPEHEKAYAMTPHEIAKHGLRVTPLKRHNMDIVWQINANIAHEARICAALEPIAPPDVAQAARVLLDAFNTDAVGKGCNAAQATHYEGSAGDADDIVEAFLRAIAGETP